MVSGLGLHIGIGIGIGVGGPEFPTVGMVISVVEKVRQEIKASSGRGYR